MSISSYYLTCFAPQDSTISRARTKSCTIQIRFQYARSPKANMARFGMICPIVLGILSSFQGLPESYQCPQTVCEGLQIGFASISLRDHCPQTPRQAVQQPVQHGSRFVPSCLLDSHSPGYSTDRSISDQSRAL